MNNNIDRITKGIAESVMEAIKVAVDDASAKKEILRGGGNSGGLLARQLMNRPLNRIRISKDALQICIEHNVTPFDYFILTQNQLRKKYGNFFASNEKTIEKCHEIGHYLTGDHNPPNKQILEDMFTMCEKNPNVDVSKFKQILNKQSLDLITIEENQKLNDAKHKDNGSSDLRDSYCSEKIEFTDLWLTPSYVPDKFFELTRLDRNKCFDPCASDGRWLKGYGLSADILPTSSNVIEKDFLLMKEEDLPDNITTIVGNIPFSLLDEFVNKALELRDECYFLVNGDNIFEHFNKEIEHVYIFSGLEGNQKDNRSRCEFDVPFLIKSALWCCIVHIKKNGNNNWIIEHDITNAERRDGYHIALGKNTFIKTNIPVDEDKRISRIEVTSSISYKGGKKITTDDGEIIDYNKYIGIK